LKKQPLQLALGLALLGTTACTLSHSKQALWSPNDPPATATARFVTEEDSGLSLLGIFMLAEPDHYAVLMERARKKHKCASLHLAQLDFYTDHWIIIAFPISRLTLVCEPEAKR
jgi:hypothetical protein